jgi:hypothetical protein
MILSRQCACGQKVEFEAEDLSQLACPSCGRSLHEQFAPPPASTPPPARFDLPPDPHANRAKLDADIARILTPGDHARVLSEVREKSCYGTLRGLINTVIGISIGVAGLAIVADVIIMTQRKGDIAAADAIVFLSCILAIVLLVAFRQALFLAIDAVDLMIANRADHISAKPSPEPRKEATVDK